MAPRITRRSFLSALVIAPIGCTSLRPTAERAQSPAPQSGLQLVDGQPGKPARLVSAWNNKVTYAADPTRGGATMPGLVGRIYVFAPEIESPMKVDGELVVDVWEQPAKGSGGEPKLLEVWQIDRESAAKLAKRDLIGDGFSIFLPWSTYHVDIKQVNVIARFTGVDGKSILAQPETLNVDHSATLAKAAEKLGGGVGTVKSPDLKQVPIAVPFGGK